MAQYLSSAAKMCLLLLVIVLSSTTVVCLLTVKSNLSFVALDRASNLLHLRTSVQPYAVFSNPRQNVDTEDDQYNATEYASDSSRSDMIVDAISSSHRKRSGPATQKLVGLDSRWNDNSGEVGRNDSVFGQRYALATKNGNNRYDDVGKYVELGNMRSESGARGTMRDKWIGYDAVRGINLKNFSSPSREITEEGGYDIWNVTWPPPARVEAGVGRQVATNQTRRRRRLIETGKEIRTQKSLAMRDRTKGRSTRSDERVKYSRSGLEMPDGFDHFYSPSSDVANFILLKIIQPRHMLLFEQFINVTYCIKTKVEKLDYYTIGDCYDELTTREVLIPRWLYHLTGFVVIGILIMLFAIFLLLLCPCVMCCRISLGHVVQAGKLDTYSDLAWATITIFSSLSILFALFGVITVACAGVGLAQYARSRPVEQVYDSYFALLEIAKIERTNAMYARMQDTDNTEVSRRAVAQTP